jgi:polyisoprenoid-binding protein YceI
MIVFMKADYSPFNFENCKAGDSLMATWKIDSAHANAEFATRHMMVAVVRGGFKNVTGTIEFDPANPEASSVEANIDATTIYSGLVDRDNHLRSADFLDIENYPTITFKSTKVEPTGDNEAKVTGNLTIRGVTRPVVIKAEFLGSVTTPFGDQRVGFSGTTNINREDFGLTWNMAIEAGGVLVGKDVRISLDVEAIKVVEPALVG